jgi:hypothetical protein
LSDRGTILVFLDDQGQLNELMVPSTRMNLIAFFVDRGSNDELHDGNYIDDRFRCKTCCRENLNELAQGSVPHFQ